MRTIIRQVCEDAQRHGDPTALYSILSSTTAETLARDERDEISDTLGDLQEQYFADFDDWRDEQ